MSAPRRLVNARYWLFDGGSCAPKRTGWTEWAHRGPWRRAFRKLMRPIRQWARWNRTVWREL